MGRVLRHAFESLGDHLLDALIANRPGRSDPWFIIKGFQAASVETLTPEPHRPVGRAQLLCNLLVIGPRCAAQDDPGPKRQTARAALSLPRPSKASRSPAINSTLCVARPSKEHKGSPLYYKSFMTRDTRLRHMAASLTFNQAFAPRGLLIASFAAWSLGGCTAINPLKTAPASAEKPWQSPETNRLAKKLDALTQDPTPPKIDLAHTYTLVDLVNIAQRTNRTTRVAWQAAREAAIGVGLSQAGFTPSSCCSLPMAAGSGIWT